MKVAVIGSGISGLAAAHRLRNHARVTLFEAGRHFGGHARTVDVTLRNAQGQRVTHGVDTGFLVFNQATYPGLTELLTQLRIPMAPSDMAFSVRVHGAGLLGTSALEWSNANWGTLFAQRRNLLRPRFLGMLSELMRFNRLCIDLLDGGSAESQDQPLGDFLREHAFSTAFRDWYLLPMLGCIWSCPTDQMQRFPVAKVMRFCFSHGLLQAPLHPSWHTISGGARQYVSAIVQGLDARLATSVTHVVRNALGVFIGTTRGTERFDAVIMAVHSDQALRLLSQPSLEEKQLLSAIRFRPIRAVLHTDTRVLPERKAAWSAWNYECVPEMDAPSERVCVHHWLNRLQPLPFAQPVLLSLNPTIPVAPAHVIEAFDHEHPVLDWTATAAQKQLFRIQGKQRTWFAGAWTGYGFHEDGLQSGYQAADALLAQLQLRDAA